MRNISICILAILLYNFHEFHVGITQVEYKKEEARVEVAIKLATSDIEKSLVLNGLEVPKLGEENEDHRADSIFNHYLLEHFKISVNDIDVPLLFLGKEVGIHDTWCYLEANKVSKGNNFSITNTLFIDFIEMQSHKVTFSSDSIIKSKMLSKIEKKFTFSL